MFALSEGASQRTQNSYDPIKLRTVQPHQMNQHDNITNHMVLRGTKHDNHRHPRLDLQHVQLNFSGNARASTVIDKTLPTATSTYYLSMLHVYYSSYNYVYNFERLGVGVIAAPANYDSRSDNINFISHHISSATTRTTAVPVTAGATRSTTKGTTPAITTTAFPPPKNHRGLPHGIMH